MDLETCLKKLQYIGVLCFCDGRSEGAPQIRQYQCDPLRVVDAIYFLPPEEKNFAANCWRTGGCRSWVQ